jgi:hypothetical protein
MTQPAEMNLHPIRAAVLRPGHRLQIESLEMTGPREDEALVRLTATGICHTDIDFCDSWSGPARRSYQTRVALRQGLSPYSIERRCSRILSMR